MRDAPCSVCMFKSSRQASAERQEFGPCTLSTCKEALGHSHLHSNCSNCRAAQPAPSSRCTRAADGRCCARCPASPAAAGPHPAPAGRASRPQGSRGCEGGACRSVRWRCSGGSRGSRTEAQAAASALSGRQGRGPGSGGRGRGSGEVCALCRFGEAAVDGRRMCLDDVAECRVNSSLDVEGRPQYSCALC